MIDECYLRVFDTPCRYDIIFGREFLCKCGMKMDLENCFMEWDDRVVDMRRFKTSLRKKMVEYIERQKEKVVLFLRGAWFSE